MVFSQQIPYLSHIYDIEIKEQFQQQPEWRTTKRNVTWI